MPALLWCGGQFGGRYQSFAYDELAERHKVRFLAMDRPGIGGTQIVPLEQRIATWLDMVPALLEHIGIKHIHLASHSAGTIFVFSTILHLRHLLHPVQPYIALFGPWVPPSITGKWTMATVGKLPDSWIGKWHHVARFMNSSVAPVITASGMAITKASRGSITSMSESKAIATDASHSDHEEKLWQKASESVITHYIFSEEIEGSSHEALLCLQKSHVKWGTWHTMDNAIYRIAANEKVCHDICKDQEGQRLRIRIFFAEDDEMVGKAGQEYLENCFANVKDKEYLDFHSEVVPGTDHNEVLTVSRGAIEKAMNEIGSDPHEEAIHSDDDEEGDSDEGVHEAMTLRDVLSSPKRPLK